MATEIALGGGRFAIVDEADMELVSAHSWWAQPGGNTFYAVTTGSIAMHRLIVGASPGEIVDHDNHNGLDNRRANLRPCSHTQNMQNSRSRQGSASRFKGVTRGYRNRWRASIQAGGERIELGSFDTEVKAAMQYDRAARLMHGRFAYTNEMMGLFEDIPQS
jgi:hypothetical protein